ncbi:MAG: DsbA family protein [Bacteroidetes bacterium]|nr:DsbA family protein [Bacteroidota bacterium]
MKPTIFYCYDAYCGWCYGFSPVIKKLAENYSNQLDFEVLSGGMIVPEQPVPISVTANFIDKAYPTVEEYTGIKFGQDYLWHIKHPDLSDWFPNSELAAIAMCIFKELYPHRQVEFAADLQYALHFEGRDLADKEAYRHLLEKYSINEEAFYEKLNSDVFKEQAHYEFQLCKQLQVSSFPCVLIQISESKFHLLARGYTNYEDLSTRLEAVLKEINA